MSSQGRIPAFLLLACLAMAIPATAIAADDCDPTRLRFPALEITAYEFRRGDVNCPSAQRIYTDCLDENGAVVRSVRGSCAPVEADDDEESTPLDEEN